MRETESYIPLAEAALGAPLFYDEEREVLARTAPEQLDPEEIEQRRLFYGVALRGLAGFRREERLSSGDDFDGAAWEPLDMQLETLRERFEPVGRRLAMLNNLERYVETYKQGRARTGLREHQQDAFDNILDFVRSTTPEIIRHPDNDPSYALTKGGYLDLPTAYGKTFLMVELSKAFGIGQPASEASPRRLRSVILVPREILVKQTIEEFEDHAPDITATPFYGREKDPTGDVVVMAYPTFNRMMAEGNMDGFQFDVVMCDEAHHGLGEQTSVNIERFRRGKLAFGLTASPDYANDRHVEQILPYLIHRTDVRTAIEAGILSGVQCVSYLTNAEIVVRNFATNDFTQKELAVLAENEARNHHATLFAKAFVESGMQGIVACIPGAECAHARKLAEELSSIEVTDPATGRKRLMRAVAVGSFLDSEKQEELLEKYEAGEIDVLTYVKMIGEGWDCDKAKFLLSLCPTTSPVRAIQRLGRVLRPGDPACVVEFIDRVANGYKKSQFTFMHVLGEDIFWQERVFGDTGVSARAPILDLQKLPAELRERIQQLEATPVDRLALSAVNVGPPPEGWLSTVDLLSVIENSMSGAYVRKLLREAGFEGRIARGRINTPTFYFPPDAAEYLRQNIILERVPEGWKQRRQIQLDFGSTQSLVERAIRVLGLEGRACRTASDKNRVRYFYSPEEQSLIAEELAKFKTSDGTKHTWDSMAEEWNVSKALVFNKSKELGLEGEYLRVRDKGPGAYYFTTAEKQQIKDALNIRPVAPEGWRSVAAIASAANVGRTVVELYLAQNNLEDSKVVYRNTAGKKTGVAVPHYPPEVADQVVAAVQPEPAPPGWVAAYDYGKANGKAPESVRRLAGRLGVERRTLRPAGRKKAREMMFLSPEAVAILDAHYAALEESASNS